MKQVKFIPVRHQIQTLYRYTHTFQPYANKKSRNISDCSEFYHSLNWWKWGRAFVYMQLLRHGKNFMERNLLVGISRILNHGISNESWIFHGEIYFKQRYREHELVHEQVQYILMYMWEYQIYSIEVAGLVSVLTLISSSIESSLESP